MRTDFHRLRTVRKRRSLALGTHTYLALLLALATAITIFVISYSYSRIIEHFPHGGGGYIVATHTIGQTAGVISGCALLVDYVLTITVSLASCGDAVFSFLPMEYHILKMPFVVVFILFLVIMNLRGVKESITALAPIFLVFILTHMLLLGYGLGTHLSRAGTLARELHGDITSGAASVGTFGLIALLLRGFSLGGGTYTGLEAVSNGMQIIREPKVVNGKRTMIYMALSLAVMAGGLLVCYLFFKCLSDLLPFPIRDDQVLSEKKEKGAGLGETYPCTHPGIRPVHHHPCSDGGDQIQGRGMGHHPRSFCPYGP